MKKLLKLFVFDFVVSALFITLGVLMLVLSDFGAMSLSFVAAALLLAYVGFYLFPRMKAARSTLQILLIIESIIILLTAVGLVLKYFDVNLGFLDLFLPSQLVGVVLWLRGICDAFRGYFLKATQGQKRFPTWRFALALLFVSLGAYFFAKPILSDRQLVFIVAAVLLLAAAILIFFGIRHLPRKTTKRNAG